MEPNHTDHRGIEIPHRLEMMLKISHVDFNRLHNLKAMRADRADILRARATLQQTNRRMQEAADQLVLPREWWYPQ